MDPLRIGFNLYAPAGITPTQLAYGKKMLGRLVDAHNAGGPSLGKQTAIVGGGALTATYVNGQQHLSVENVPTKPEEGRCTPLGGDVAEVARVTWNLRFGSIRPGFIPFENDIYIVSDWYVFRFDKETHTLTSLAGSGDGPFVPIFAHGCYAYRNAEGKLRIGAQMQSLLVRDPLTFDPAYPQGGTPGYPPANAGVQWTSDDFDTSYFVEFEEGAGWVERYQSDISDFPLPDLVTGNTVNALGATYTHRFVPWAIQDALPIYNNYTKQSSPFIPVCDAFMSMAYPGVLPGPTAALRTDVNVYAGTYDYIKRKWTVRLGQSTTAHPLTNLPDGVAGFVGSTLYGLGNGMPDDPVPLPDGTPGKVNMQTGEFAHLGGVQFRSLGWYPAFARTTLQLCTTLYRFGGRIINPHYDSTRPEGPNNYYLIDGLDLWAYDLMGEKDTKLATLPAPARYVVPSGKTVYVFTYDVANNQQDGTISNWGVYTVR